MGKQQRQKRNTAQPRTQSVNSIDWEQYVFDRVLDGTFHAKYLTRGFSPTRPHERNRTMTHNRLADD